MEYFIFNEFPEKSFISNSSKKDLEKNWTFLNLKPNF